MIFSFLCSHAKHFRFSFPFFATFFSFFVYSFTFTLTHHSPSFTFAYLRFHCSFLDSKNNSDNKPYHRPSHPLSVTLSCADSILPMTIPYQRFRHGDIIESLAVRKDKITGEHYSRVIDIQETFSGAVRFKVNGIVLNFLEDENEQR